MPHIPLYGVYGIINLINSKTYVGSGNIPSRICNHYNFLLKGEHTNRKLQNSWNKHGEKNFAFFRIEYCDKDATINKEQYWIDKLDAVRKGFNISPTAGKPIGVRWTPEMRERQSKSPITRAKISSALRGRKLTDAHREILSIRSKERSKEISIMMSDLHKGKPKSDKHREKLADSNRRRAKEPGFGKMVSEAKMGKRRLPFSDEWRSNLSKAQALRWSKVKKINEQYSS